MNKHPTLLISGTLSDTLKDKTIVLAVTGSIAAVRTVELARELIRHGAAVQAVVSEAAVRIIHPEALQYATGRPVITAITGGVEHVEYCGEDGTADLLLIAPCTANTIGKMASGISDTPPTTFAAAALGCKMPVVVVPAMHGSMYSHSVVLENMEKLKAMGVDFVGPIIEENIAKITTNDDIVLYVQRKLGDGSLKEKKVIITGGGTKERIDPIRVLTSRASGRTGIALAREAFRRGSEVTLVHPEIKGLFGITEVRAESAQDLTVSVLDGIAGGCDLLISSAAISDYTAEPSDSKIKSGLEELSITFHPTSKLIRKVRELYTGLDIIGFKAEANVGREDLLSSARDLMTKYGLLMVVANDVGKNGMGTQQNTVCILNNKDDKVREITGDKQLIARAIFDEFLEVR